MAKDKKRNFDSFSLVGEFSLSRQKIFQTI